MQNEYLFLIQEVFSSKPNLLRKWLERNFKNPDKLRHLCHELQIEYEQLRGEAPYYKAIDLAEEILIQQQIPQLIQHLQNNAPELLKSLFEFAKQSQVGIYNDLSKITAENIDTKQNSQYKDISSQTTYAENNLKYSIEGQSQNAPDFLKPMAEPIDIVVISALREELDALTEKLTNVEKDNIKWISQQKLSGGFICKIGEFTFANKKLRIAAAHALNKMGLTETAMLATSAIFACNPKLVVMIGICAGRYKETARENEKINIGDIILVNSAWHYYFGKISEIKVENSNDNEQEVSQNLQEFIKEEFKPEPKYENVKDELLHYLIEAVKDKEVLSYIRNKYPTEIGKPGYALKAHDGPIGSSDLVVAAASRFQKAVDANRKLIAVDMESYAALRVAQRFGQNAVVIKSVSDYGDKRKGQSDYEHYREYAYFTAAAAFCKFVKYLAEETDFFLN